MAGFFLPLAPMRFVIQALSGHVTVEQFYHLDFFHKRWCVFSLVNVFQHYFMLDRHEKSFGESHQDSSNATLGSRPGKILEVTNAKLRSLGQKVCVETNLEGLASI